MDVSLIATNIFGCSDSAEDVLAISGTGIKKIDNAGEDLKIYPNPGEGTFQVRFNNTGPGEVLMEVFDVNGRMIKNIRKHMSVGENLMVIDELRAGLYFVRITTRDSWLCGKIICVE